MSLRDIERLIKPDPGAAKASEFRPARRMSARSKLKKILARANEYL
jgi:hypothetical protein